MLEMREQSTYPRDFDYKKVLEGAVNEKYYSFSELCTH